MRIITLDPGGTTGMAVREPGGGIYSCSYEHRHELYAYLEQWSGEPTTYVVETFVPRPGVRTWVPDSLFIWGYVDGRLPFWHYASRLVLQTPAQAKSFATDAKLRKVGFYTPGTDHARDAMRHMLVFLCTTSEGHALGGKQLLEKLVS